MTLLLDIEKKAQKNHARIGLGVGIFSSKLIKSAEDSNEFAEVVLIGNKKELEKNTSLEIIDSKAPHETLIKLLIDGKIDGAVRGNLSATKTLSELKKSLNIKKLYRIALLETPYGVPFFFAPVGIDEGNSIADKIELIIRGIEHIDKLGVKAKVGILSGGRFEDIGRHEIVDRTLADSELITKVLCDKGINAKHYAILIEDAIKEANFIIAPDGISGNLIFRTLVFLGGGYGHGASVMLDKVFIDTSRVGEDYKRAIIFASACFNPCFSGCRSLI